MSIKTIANKISAIERKRSKVIEQLVSAQNMIRGSFSQIKRKCGKPNCWCRNGSGHPYTRITWNEGTQPKSKSIPKKDLPWIKEAAEIYKKFRQWRHEIKIQEYELNELLNLYEKTVIETTKKKKKIDW